MKSAAKPLLIQSAFGTSLASALFLGCQPEEAYGPGGDPIPGSRTFLLQLHGKRLTRVAEVPFAIVSTFLSGSGVAYCGSVESGTLYKWHAGRWSEEIFSKKPVASVRYIFAIPGAAPEEDTVFVATQKDVFVREGGRWKKQRVPGEGLPFQMDGSRADQVFIGGSALCVWDGNALQELDEPEDDRIRVLALTGDDRLVGGNTYVNISSADGSWDRIDTPETGIYYFARFKDAIYALTDEAGVMRVHPGRPKVVSPAVGQPTGLFSVGDGMIATGYDNVLAFDGKTWFPVAIPLCEKGKSPQ